jgi:phosphoribosylanthranilate isomerase
MRIKICGIVNPEQGQAIAESGATALGFICVRQTPRYVTPQQIRAIVDRLPSAVDRVGVFANAKAEEISQIVEAVGLSCVQLHGDESPEFCQQLRQLVPTTEIIKAFRIRSVDALKDTEAYCDRVDTFLFDAYHPQAWGGTGKTLDWEALSSRSPSRPWFLSGGLTPENVTHALQLLTPTGIDLSSGVERSPGDKDLEKVSQLFRELEKR